MTNDLDAKYINKARLRVIWFLRQVGLHQLPPINIVGGDIRGLTLTCDIQDIKWVFAFDFSGEMLTFSGDSDLRFRVEPADIPDLLDPPDRRELERRVETSRSDGAGTERPSLDDQVDTVRRYFSHIPTIFRRENMSSIRDKLLRQREEFYKIRSERARDRISNKQICPASKPSL